MVLWKLGFRYTWNRPGRTLLTLLSIVIGVAAVVSIGIATSTTRVAYRQMFATLTGRAALEMTADGGGAFDESLLNQVEQIPAVRAAAPVLQRFTVMYAGGRRMKLVAMGVDPAKDPAVRDYQLAEGRPLAANETGAVLEIGFARSVGIKLNDQVKLLTRRGLWRVPVVGLLRVQGASSFFLGGVVFVPLHEAQRAFGQQGQVDRIQVVLNDGADRTAVQAAIARRLPVGIGVRPPATQTPLVEQTLLAANHGLRLATAFSLLLAAFIILNTFLMNVTERRRQLAVLRAVGATRRQVARLLVSEGLLFGIVGTALGILVGLAGARVLTHALDQILMSALPSLNVTVTPFLFAVLFGLGISLLGSSLPASRAASLSPLEGIDGVVREDMERHWHGFTVAGLGVCLISGAVILACMLGLLRAQLAVAGCILLLVGLVLMIPVVLDKIVQLFVWLFAPRMGVEARLAYRQIPRHHTRSALTVGVLFVAVSAGVGIASAVLDNMRNVEEWYHRSIIGDFFVRAMMPDMATGMSADLPEALGQEIRRVPGITGIDTIRFVQARAAGQSVIVVVRDFPPGAPMHFDLKAGDPARVLDRLRQGDVVVGTVLAQKAGLKLGDMIPVETLQGPQTFRIAGLTNEYLVGGLSVYMERSIARRWLGVEGVDGYAIRTEPRSRAAVQAQLQILADKYGVLLHSFADISRLIDNMMLQIDGCLWGILVLGFVVAAFGVVNTLTMNVVEQTRELGLLRVVAMTRRQVRKTILYQAAVLGTAGIGPGIVAGVGLSYLINVATMPAIGHPVEFNIHPVLLAGSLVGALVIVLAAAWIPAQRAARLELTEALQYE